MSGQYRNHAVGCEEVYEHEGGCQPPLALREPCDELLTDEDGTRARCTVSSGLEHSHHDHTAAGAIAAGLARAEDPVSQTCHTCGLDYSGTIYEHAETAEHQRIVDEYRRWPNGHLTQLYRDRAE